MFGFSPANFILEGIFFVTLASVAMDVWARAVYLGSIYALMQARFG